MKSKSIVFLAAGVVALSSCQLSELEKLRDQLEQAQGELEVATRGQQGQVAINDPKSAIYGASFVIPAGALPDGIQEVALGLAVVDDAALPATLVTTVGPSVRLEISDPDTGEPIVLRDNGKLTIPYDPDNPGIFFLTEVVAARQSLAGGQPGLVHVQEYRAFEEYDVLELQTDASGIFTPVIGVSGSSAFSGPGVGGTVAYEVGSVNSSSVDCEADINVADVVGVDGSLVYDRTGSASGTRSTLTFTIDAADEFKLTASFALEHNEDPPIDAPTQVTMAQLLTWNLGFECGEDGEDAELDLFSSLDGDIDFDELKQVNLTLDDWQYKNDEDDFGSVSLSGTIRFRDQLRDDDQATITLDVQFIDATWY